LHATKLDSCANEAGIWPTSWLLFKQRNSMKLRLPSSVSISPERTFWLRLRAIYKLGSWPSSPGIEPEKSFPPIHHASCIYYPLIIVVQIRTFSFVILSNTWASSAETV
jgi:hypothetical protein